MNDPHIRWFIILLLLVLVIAVNTLSGCTQLPERYLSVEDDKQIAELCEKNGCAIVDRRHYESMKKALGACGYREM